MHASAHDLARSSADVCDKFIMRRYEELPTHWLVGSPSRTNGGLIRLNAARVGWTECLTIHRTVTKYCSQLQ